MSEAIFQIDDLNPVNSNNNEVEDELAQFDLTLKKKKKKKTKENKVEENKDTNEVKENVENVEDEKEYDYVYLLDRFFSILREKNPSLVTRKMKIIPPPILHGMGKKTMWANFSTIAGILKRTVDHIQSYINYEMSTESSIDGNMRLIIKGKFNSKNLETVLKKYIITYVSCQMCKGHETSLIKDPITRVCFIKCDTCKSSKSVDTIIKKSSRI
jgi:translation initiation factor 2 subunit 2